MKSLKSCFHNNKLIIFGVMGLIISFMLSIMVGSSRMNLNELIGGLMGNEVCLTYRNIFLYIRLPRTLAAMLSGAGLAVSGAILQAVLSNKLASPGIIGVNAGAGLGVSICCMLGILSGTAISLSAFLGSLAAVTLITVGAMKTRASKTTVILGGVAVNAVFNAIAESITVLNPDVAIFNAEFRIGGFSSVSYLRLIPAGILIVIGLIIILTLLNDLDVLSLGDETASGLGMSVKRTKTAFLILSALLSGASVSFAGLLGFVGLIVPNFICEIKGSESRKVIPLCGIYGGIFVTLCDVLSRTIFSPYELPVGILMAIIGGPFFVAVLIKSRGGRR